MSNIIDQAQKIIEANGFADSETSHALKAVADDDAGIMLVKGKLEEAELPLKEFDIIVSEWMGYFLLYESMLDTVLLARDKYLKQGGMMFPDTAVMYISAIEDQDYKEEKINCESLTAKFSAHAPTLVIVWDKVYGFDYSCIKEVALREPLVDTVELKAVVTDPCEIKVSSDMP